METERKQRNWLHLVAYFAMILIIGVLGYQNFALKVEKKAFVEHEIMMEYKLLNVTRIHELNKSMTTLKLFECKGINRHVIDSIKLHLFVSNDILIKRDSSYIAARYHELK